MTAMRPLRQALVVAAIGWPLLGGSVVALEVAGRAPGLGAAVYLAASRICHQDPSRSFATAGVQWPVCGRCSGLYLAAPVGALLALRRRPQHQTGSRQTGSRQTGSRLLLAALPTILTLAVEWLQLAPVSSLVRALAAVPLGAAVTAALVGVLDEPAEPIRYTDRP
jgi:hypothetical protein